MAAVPSATGSFRLERTIAGGRLAVGIVVALALLVEPLSGTAFRPQLGGPEQLVARGVAVAYVAYSALLLWWSWWPLGMRVRLPRSVAAHVVDHLVAGTLMLLTGAHETPFFTWVIFLILVAAVRWAGGFALASGIATIAMFLAVALYQQLVLPTEIDAGRFLFRIVVLGLTVVLLAGWRAQRDRFVGEVQALSLAGAAPAGTLDDALGPVLRAGRSALGAAEVVAAWDDPEEPWRFTCTLGRGGLHVARTAIDDPVPLLVAPALAATPFLVAMAPGREPRVLRVAASGVEPWSGEALPTPAAPGIRSVVYAPFADGESRGGVLVHSESELLPTSIITCEILAQNVGAAIQVHRLTVRIEEASRVEAEARISRDLHDGVLQSLTGAAMMVRRARELIVSDPAAASEMLGRVERLVAEEQRDLRMLVLERRADGGTGGADSLATMLAGLAARMESVWGMEVTVEVEPAASSLPDDGARQLFRLAQEALTNAARHGGAATARVAVRRDGNAIDLVVEDSGRGFAPGADGSVPQPTALRARLASIGGSLHVDSAPGRVRLAMRIPAAAAGVAR